MTGLGHMPRLVVFGDSHYACLRHAHRLGLVDVSGTDLEYWGHVGKRFLFLEFRDGAIHPTDDFTANRFAKFNEKGRLFLPPADFDMVLIAGARTQLSPLFRTLLYARMHGPFITSGLRRRIVRDFLHTKIGYNFARHCAATGTARIVLSPVALPTEGAPQLEPAVTPEMRAAGAEQRAEIWDTIVDVAAAEGITVIPQPEETVTAGMFTRAAFAIENHVERNDFEHRNPAYGALVFSRALQILNV